MSSRSTLSFESNAKQLGSFCSTQRLAVRRLPWQDSSEVQDLTSRLVRQFSGRYSVSHAAYGDCRGFRLLVSHRLQFTQSLTMS